MAIKLIVGLGNPGDKYRFNRHNIGFLALEKWCESSSPRYQKKFKGLYAKIKDTVVLYPQTYMNLSGESVSPAAHFFKVKPEEILVIHDELDLEFGTVHLKQGGGHAGHNGLRSMDQHLSSKNYYRMRMGIGRPVHGDVSSWVLGNFTKDQVDDLARFTDGAAEIIDDIFKQGIVKVQNVWNKKSLI